ncbi:uncharacterized protein LOC123398576 [Hordeum vulgare subsp. vulgare]|uniref:UspA domain-containing protein n=1 Tax=Hordeum vulgare subsp. vulgare TaxID=112509 RepID=A0A8I6XFE4_HORVV|nr:uncharacterized protein LOC123398576 [Hordeum vulgare subsp. vulgare]
MGRRLPALCRGRAATRVRKRVQRLTYCSPSSSKLPPSVTSKVRSDAGAGNGRCYGGGNGASMVDVVGGMKDGGGRRVMVVADGRAEAVGALEWALSQVVRSNDAVVLLAVVKPAPADADDSSCVKISRTRCYEHLNAMRSLCESTRPEVKVEVCVTEAEERAPAVVDAARRHGASLLVLGQRRRAATARWILGLWPAADRRCGGRWQRGLVEYCIEHAPCEALGVRRRNSGGYLVSSRRHRDFWLLA